MFCTVSGFRIGQRHLLMGRSVVSLHTQPCQILLHKDPLGNNSYPTDSPFSVSASGFHVGIIFLLFSKVKVLSVQFRVKKILQPGVCEIEVAACDTWLGHHFFTKGKPIHVSGCRGRLLQEICHFDGDLWL